MTTERAFRNNVEINTGKINVKAHRIKWTVWRWHLTYNGVWWWSNMKIILLLYSRLPSTSITTKFSLQLYECRSDTAKISTLRKIIIVEKYFSRDSFLLNDRNSIAGTVKFIGIGDKTCSSTLILHSVFKWISQNPISSWNHSHPHTFNH